MKRLPLVGLATLAALALALAGPSGALAQQHASASKIGFHKKTKPAAISIRINPKGPAVVLRTRGGKTVLSSKSKLGSQGATGKKRTAKTRRAHKSHKTHKSHKARKGRKHARRGARRTRRRHHHG